MDEPRYYYAGGERIALQPVKTRVAVDLARAGPPASAAGRWAAALVGTRPLRGEIRLVDRRDIPADVFTTLEEQAAILPVYRHGKTLIVILPEVRVELEEGEGHRIREFLASFPVKAEVTPGKYGQVTLHPTSGQGADAMKLANGIYEGLHPRSSQASFLRVSPRPGPPRKAR